MTLWVAAGLLVSLAVGVDESLRATLLRMGRDDQEAIRIATANPSRPPSEQESRQINDIGQRNRGLIRQIVQEHGWPGRSVAGDDGAHAAWLVVQHMDEDVAFQRSCLTLMQEAFSAGEVSAHDLAYLTDRVLTGEGKPQMYGTQGTGVTSREDEARIDRNRAAIGLPPWRDAVKERQRDYANGYGRGR
ncbi:MAG TPA: DUF6624 domain-containing protein [Candidatus Polarisedimenticolaceae bacterium]|nr:DUF6624 domain-containing protein [Candidatus Polarisedimenticolaceae bacterium]